MSIYDYNDTKIYPDLSPTAPQVNSTINTTINSNWGISSWWNWGPQAGGEKKETIKYNHRYHRHRLSYFGSDRWKSLYPSICQRCWPSRWYCLRWAWDSSFPFNGRHTKIFQEPNSETRKTWCYYAAYPKQVRQHSQYHFTGNARRRHLPHRISQSIARGKNIVNLRPILETEPRPR